MLCFSARMLFKLCFKTPACKTKLFGQVKVYASDPWYVSQPGFIRDLKIETNLDVNVKSALTKYEVHTFMKKFVSHFGGFKIENTTRTVLSLA